MAEVSTQQMALTRDLGPGGFMERVIAVLQFVARDVLESEAANTPHHTERVTYARTVGRNPRDAAIAAGPMVVMGVNIVSTTTYDEATKVATCTATDPELQSQVTTFFNPLAGIDAAS
jgi:hypothetical protein